MFLWPALMCLPYACDSVVHANCCKLPAGYVQQLNMHSGLYSSLSRALSQYEQAAAQGGQEGQVRCACGTAQLQCPQRSLAGASSTAPADFSLSVGWTTHSFRLDARSCAGRKGAQTGL